MGIIEVASDIIKFPFKYVKNYRVNILGKKRIRIFQEEKLNIPLDTIDSINYINYSNHFKINPSFIDNEHGYVRVTSHSFLGRENRTGRMLGRHGREIALKNGIYYFSIEGAKITFRPVFSFGDTPNFEDPRYYSNGKESYLSLTAVKQASKREGWKFYPAIYNLESKQLKIFDEDRFINQKNWIIRDCKDGILTITTNFNPYSEISYNTKTAEILLQELAKRNELKLNGGSNYLAVGDYQIRVLRERVKVNKYGAVHLSYIALYKEHELHQLSKPFNFREIGMEICNSITLEHDTVSFFWTFNDLEVFQGKIGITALLEFVNNNQYENNTELIAESEVAV